MVDENLLSMLHANRLFSSLDEETCKTLLPQFTPVTLTKGEILFEQGDPSDSLYLLITGKLAASLMTVSGQIRIVGHIEAGDVVGELGAISNEPRSLTIKALTDSQLLKLSAKQFVDMSHRYPSILFATLHPIIARSRSIIQLLSAEKKNKHIVVVPAHNDIWLKDFYARLINYAEQFKTILIFSDFDPVFSDKNASAETIRTTIRNIAHDKKAALRYIYLLSSFSTPLARFGFKNADMLYIAAESRSVVKIDNHILDQIHSRRRNLRAEPNLILIHPEGTERPQNTLPWLNTTDFQLYHHVRMDNNKDFARLLRFMRGRAVGLVLSGGGTRGWSHFGVIKALRESKIPIDIIGGTSVGAVVGSCYALYQSYEEAYKRFYDIVVEAKGTASLRGLTWPAVSLFSGKKYTNALKKAFENFSIEEMWLPYYCVSSNLATTTEFIHTSGLIWEKNRASSSIPGIMPPMVLDDEMHLDGGLLNNLPVDIMRQYVGNKGKIIAVELNSYSPHRLKYIFPPILTFRNVFFSKIGLGKNRINFPPFIDTFLRGLFLGSVIKAKQNSLAANIFVSLSLSQYPLMVSNPEQADELIEIGYKETIRHIQKEKSTEPEPQQPT